MTRYHTPSRLITVTTFNPSKEQMEAYREQIAAAEAETVARWEPNRINGYLERVAKARGQEAADRLRVATREAYRANRSNHKGE